MGRKRKQTLKALTDLLKCSEDQLGGRIQWLLSRAIIPPITVTITFHPMDEADRLYIGLSGTDLENLKGPMGILVQQRLLRAAEQIGQLATAPQSQNNNVSTGKDESIPETEA